MEVDSLKEIVRKISCRRLLFKNQKKVHVGRNKTEVKTSYKTTCTLRPQLVTKSNQKYVY